MDTLSQLSEPHSFGSGMHDVQGKCEAQRRGSISDEEVILASSRPKKRAGRKIFRETRHPVYRGVRRRNSNRWVCELREPNKKTRIWLGTHPTLEMAARAHDVAALALRGHLACLNFADSAWRLPVPASKNVRDIQRAATQAAELFRPREFGGVHVLGNESESSTDNAASSESSDSTKPPNLNTDFPVNMVFLDEDAIFDMPSLLKDMAQGLLLSPPRVAGWYDMESDDANVNMQLWSFSV